jgi:hypothetical protein
MPLISKRAENEFIDQKVAKTAVGEKVGLIIFYAEVQNAQVHKKRKLEFF